MKEEELEKPSRMSKKKPSTDESNGNKSLSIT
jgi:hypothetical protein